MQKSLNTLFVNFYNICAVFTHILRNVSAILPHFWPQFLAHNCRSVFVYFAAIFCNDYFLRLMQTLSVSAAKEQALRTYSASINNRALTCRYLELLGIFC